MFRHTRQSSIRAWFAGISEGDPIAITCLVLVVVMMVTLGVVKWMSRNKS